MTHGLVAGYECLQDAVTTCQCLVTGARMCRPVQTSGRGEEVLWNRINRQEVGGGSGWKQRNWPEINSIHTLSYCYIPSIAWYCIPILHSTQLSWIGCISIRYFSPQMLPGLYLCGLQQWQQCRVSRDQSLEEHRKRLSLGASKVDSAVNKNASSLSPWKADTHWRDELIVSFSFKTVKNDINNDLLNY